MKRPSWMNYKPKIKQDKPDSLDRLMVELMNQPRSQGMTFKAIVATKTKGE